MAKVILAVLVILAVAGACYAQHDGQVAGGPDPEAHQEHLGQVTGAMPEETGPTEVSGPPETPETAPTPTSEVGSGGEEVTSRYQTREGHDEAARKLLASDQPAKAERPQVWHGTVAGRKRTEVYVRERGRTRNVYAGPRLTQRQVSNLIAEWARKAGVASQSFVRKHVESRIAPLRRELGGLNQDVASIKGDITDLQGRVASLEAKSQEAKHAPTTPATKPAPTPSPVKGSLRQLWRDNPWLVLAAICLTLALAGVVTIILKLRRRST